MTDQLIAEQLKHTLDLIKAELAQIRSDTCHTDELSRVRLDNIETMCKDFETRIRSLQDSSNQFKLLVSLATGGGLLSLIGLIRELIR